MGNFFEREARSTALEVLCRWEEMGMPPIARLLEEELRRFPLPDPRDYGLVMALVYGVLRRRGYLDWVIADFSRHPLGKMKCRTLQALRVGLYQLVFMDRIPASAAINETVRALKTARQPHWLTGYVNGLLRNISRNIAKLPSPDAASDRLPLSRRMSHPAWLFERWQKRYGRARTMDICQCNNTEPPLSLRVNTEIVTVDRFIKKLARAGIRARPGCFAPAAVRLSEYNGPVAGIPGYAAGFFQVQDEAAQLVSCLLTPLASGKIYLDGCAGVGGKTSHLAQMLPDDGLAARLFAVEPNNRRLQLLKENLTRLQLSSRVNIIHGGLATLRVDKGGGFAGVLIDAPCSGLGVIRRHPDIRWSRQPADLLRHQQKQLALLAATAPLIKAGGVLVYAVCSMEPEESDEVVAEFLADRPEFILSECKDFLPAAARELVDGRGCFRTVPDTRGLDGFFAARFEKRSEP